jgi:uncharacterized phiE125 gp8 family phage protein
MDRFRDKQANEAYFIEFDFTNMADTAPTISSAVVSAKIVSTGVDATATITTAGSQTVSGSSVNVWVKAGTTGTDYQITCVATASDGSVYELEGLMLVVDVPLAAPTAITGPGCVVPPVIEPISLAELQTHLRVDCADEDESLTGLISSARQAVENITRRGLLTQTHDYCLKDWPDEDFIKLPYGNLASVTSVKWKDTDGTETTLTVTTDYLVETNQAKCGRIVLPYAESWPTGDLFPSNPITIRFVCGWTTAALVPSEIRSAVKFAAEDEYYHGDRSDVLKPIINRLLASWRLWDEF